MKVEKIGTIALEGMRFLAYHGVYEKEREEGNYFIVDLFVEADVSQPSLSDNLNDTINYELLYKEVEKIMREKYKLLEHVAHLILSRLEKFPVRSARVKVTKMKPPIKGDVEKVSVEIERTYR